MEDSKAQGNKINPIYIKGVKNYGTIFFNTEQDIIINNVVFENLTN